MVTSHLTAFSHLAHTINTRTNQYRKRLQKPTINSSAWFRSHLKTRHWPTVYFFQHRKSQNIAEKEMENFDQTIKLAKQTRNQAPRLESNAITIGTERNMW